MNRADQIPPVEPELVRAWIALQHARGTPQYDELFWSFDRVDRLCRNEPGQAWQFVLAVLAADQSDVVIQNLAAGPLEDLLAKHPYDVIKRVEAKALKSPAFARLLGGVWQNAMPDDIWRRVQIAWDRRGWDGLPAAESDI